MTEKELRQKVVSTALAWMGTREYSAKHQEMLDIYNSQQRHADARLVAVVRGVRVHGLPPVWPARHHADRVRLPGHGASLSGAGPLGGG